MSVAENINCPLCTAVLLRPALLRNGKRNFHSCAHCDLIFSPANELPSEELERSRYELHENSATDIGYRTFLNRLAQPLSELLAPGARGLDFGCGPGPTLSIILEEKGYSVRNYDPYFYPDAEYLNEKYDFITATEVLEHLFSPEAVLRTLFGLLKPGGCLAVMTETLPERTAFEAWHYPLDPTHVRFYSERTFEWIRAHFGAQMKSPHPNVRFYTL